MRADPKDKLGAGCTAAGAWERRSREMEAESSRDADEDCTTAQRAQFLVSCTLGSLDCTPPPPVLTEL